MNLENYGTINQTVAHARTSDKYSFISTKRVLDVFADYGYFPSRVIEKRTRVVANRGFQTHLIRLSKPELRGGAEMPEILLKGSHMGTAAWELFAGVIRFICGNGLVVKGASFGEYKIRHVGYTDELVAKAIEGITQTLPLITGSIERFKAIELTPNEAGIFAASAALVDEESTIEVDPNALLRARRYEDGKPDLWSTYNRVQENMIRGGIRGRTANNQRRLTRAVGNIDSDVKINRGLWLLTENMAELKQAN